MLKTLEKEAACLQGAVTYIPPTPVIDQMPAATLGVTPLGWLSLVSLCSR